MSARRIEAGRLRGRKLLDLPRGVDVRPTSARVRGAIFDRLQGEVDGARVLDAFAGSGGLAIEALSRGASAATLIERDPQVARFLERQLEALDLDQAAHVHNCDAVEALTGPVADGVYDLVLADPPYADAEQHERLLAVLVDGERLAASAVVVCERERIRGEAPPIPLPPQLALEATRRHGQTVLDFIRRRR